MVNIDAVVLRMLDPCGEHDSSKYLGQSKVDRRIRLQCDQERWGKQVFEKREVVSGRWLTMTVCMEQLTRT